MSTMRREGHPIAEASLPVARYAVTATAARIVAEALAITLVLLGTARGVSPRSLGVLVACWTLPQVLTAPMVGAMADRARRPARLLAGFIAIGAVGLAAVGVGLGVAPIAVLCVLAVLISFAEPAIMGGLSGIATRSADLASSFTAWDAVSYGAAGILAQLLVSVSASVSGPAATVCIVVAIAAGAAVLVATLPLRPMPADHEPSRPAAVLRILFGDRELRSMTVLTTVALSAFGGVALAAVHLAEQLGRPSGDGSHLILAMAIGAVVGSLIATRRAPPRAPLRSAAVCVAATGVAFAASAVGNWPTAIAAFLVVGVADGPLLVATFVTRTRRSPEDARASVYTVAASLKIAATSIGALTVGFVGSPFGGGSGVIVLAAIQAVALIAFSITRLR